MSETETCKGCSLSQGKDFIVQNNEENYNVFAIENEHPEQPVSANDTYLEEQGDTNITIDSLYMCYDKEQDNQDDTDELAQERDLLAFLIEKLKYEIDDSKNRNKFLETSNKALVNKLKGEIEDFKTKNKSLESSNNHFKEANNELLKTNQLMFKDLKKFQAELDSSDPKRNFVPTTVATKSGQVSVNAAKQSSPRAAVSISTARPVNTAAPKSKGNPQYNLKDQGIFYSGYSRHMTGNKSFLLDYQKIDGGFVAFGGSPKGGKITGKGRKHALSFMRPFGCPVTILNTLDHLGKFDGKSDDRVFVGYSNNSKAFRVFNTRTRFLEENLHINFLENKLNVVGTGPNWMFDIDTLTMSMNYQPIFAGDQTNGNAGTKANIDEGQGGMKTVPGPQYALLPFLTSDSQSPKSSKDEVADDAEKKNEVLDPAKEDDKSGQGEATNTNSTNRLNIISSSINIDANGNSIYRMFTPVNAAGSSYDNLGGSISLMLLLYLPIDPLMLDLENIANLLNTGIFSGAYDDEDVGAEADFNNLKITMNVSPIPTTRIHNDHPKNQIIGDINSATQTRRMTKISKEHAMKVTQALTDPSWIEAMQDELLQFRLQKVWRLVDLPKGKHAIGTKWVYRNKKDKRGIVVRNKARLVAQGYTQEEGIDYDKVFAPVARIEAIRLFLAYASFMGFIVYQMDVKSAFLYGTIEEEVYVCQPPSFEDPQFPNKVYKVEKALYGLHQAPRAWYETLSTYLLENGFRRGTIDKTLFIKKDKGDILLVQVYVDDIIFGSTKKSLLLYRSLKFDAQEVLDKFYGTTHFLLRVAMKTTSTLIETNKALLKDEEAEDVDVHLYKSMIRSLMYLTASRPDIMFAICACASDYARASLDRKSTTGGCQFLGKRQISWQCKKQTIVANSTTEAEYVAAANCYGQTATVRTVDNEEQEITATVDGKEFTITEASVRRHLQLADVEGISAFPTTEIFDQLSLMRYVLTDDKLTFQKEAGADATFSKLTDSE
ncbi:putative ribonuclease H-like domain-containing protein [Tanacetum coccineum]|uniref:Ribonuclease H-like domain-containing protein n=1 Tax=Tanacetum coccineum TaxID=301880 RepID=A0ABQ5DPN9_9ASTR